MPRIAQDTARSLLNFLVSRGLNRDDLLACIGLTDALLNRSGELIHTETYEALYNKGAEYLEAPQLGFEFGQNIAPDRWGILGYIAYTSHSVSAAIDNQRRYQTLVGNLGAPLLEQQENHIILKWIPAYHCSHHTVEEIITGWVALARDLTNQSSIGPSEIYFGHPCQSSPKPYQEYFQCAVTFDYDYHGIRVPKAMLRIPFHKHDPEIHQLLCAKANSMINNLAERLPVEIVSKFIMNQLPIGVPEIDDAAQHLQLSVRTLQRKLSEHQLTFSGLIDTIRKDLALSYLSNTNTKIVYISQMLGFSEQSAFQRAFKRWTQQTPKQFRDSCTPNHLR